MELSKAEKEYLDKLLQKTKRIPQKKSLWRQSFSTPATILAAFLFWVLGSMAGALPGGTKEVLSLLSVLVLVIIMISLLQKVGLLNGLVVKLHERIKEFEKT